MKKASIQAEEKYVAPEIESIPVFLEKAVLSDTGEPIGDCEEDSNIPWPCPEE